MGHEQRTCHRRRHSHGRSTEPGRRGCLSRGAARSNARGASMTPERRKPVLTIADLEAGYGDLRILKGVSIFVGESEIVSIIGANGAGKSTLLKAIYGLVQIYRGRIVCGLGEHLEDICNWKPHRITALGLNYVPQRANIFPRMS